MITMIRPPGRPLPDGVDRPQTRGARAGRWRGPLVLAVVLGTALWLQRRYLADVPQALAAVGGSHLGWVALAVVGSVVTYLMAAFAMIGSVHQRLSLGRAVQVQFASGLTTLSAPAGVGAAGINIWFLERVGLARRDAVGATLRNGLAGGVVHVVALAIVVVKLPELIAIDIDHVRAVAARAVPLVGGLSVTILAIAVWHRKHALRATQVVREGWDTTLTLLRRPDRAFPLVAGSVGLSLAYGVTFWASAQAVGVPLDLPTAIAIELVVQALGGVAATPGGIGVVEAASFQALLLVGAGPAAALAAVLLHRLLTFWLPAVPGAVALRGLQKALPRATAIT